MTGTFSAKILTNPKVALVILTVCLQATNFIFDWKTVSFYPQITINYAVNVGDNTEYFGIAGNLLSGKGYTAPSFLPFGTRKDAPTYLRTPGLPFLYMVPLYLFGSETGYLVTEDNREHVWVFLYVLYVSLLCVGAVYFYKLCCLLISSSLLSFLGALVYIIWPSNLVFLSPSLGLFTPEVPVTPLLVWICYMLLESKTFYVTLLVGVVLGYCILTRVHLILLPFSFLGVSGLFQNPMLKKQIWVVAFVSLAVLSPWPIHNYLAFHDFSLSSQGGRHLWLGNNAYARGSYDGVMHAEASTSPERFPLLKDLDERFPGLIDMTEYSETQVNRILRHEALNWMKANVDALPWLLMRKLAITFYPTNYENNNRVNIFTATVFLLFMPGLALYVWRCIAGSAPREFLLLLMPILCMSLVTVIFYAEYRVRFMMEPFMIMFAIYGVCELLKNHRFLSKCTGARRSQDNFGGASV